MNFIVLRTEIEEQSPHVAESLPVGLFPPVLSAPLTRPEGVEGTPPLCSVAMPTTTVLTFSRVLIVESSYQPYFTEQLC